MSLEGQHAICIEQINEHIIPACVTGSFSRWCLMSYAHSIKVGRDGAMREMLRGPKSHGMLDWPKLN
ncbi:hypothetical protein PENSUB_13405 [Penicillium subrubescens]|uniref:Uncharacterized protein n=1 Tax=Penicillium subrubescens TaxID=1316194 RepID=A0A1Q5SQN9_9EURO|nr:hypothetical protein PENSUB_13405 [Penicillium subrubescens]